MAPNLVRFSVGGHGAPARGTAAAAPVRTSVRGSERARTQGGRKSHAEPEGDAAFEEEEEEDDEAMEMPPLGEEMEEAGGMDDDGEEEEEEDLDPLAGDIDDDGEDFGLPGAGVSREVLGLTNAKRNDSAAELNEEERRLRKQEQAARRREMAVQKSREQNASAIAKIMKGDNATRRKRELADAEAEERRKRRVMDGELLPGYERVRYRRDTDATALCTPTGTGLPPYLAAAARARAAVKK